MSAHAAQLVVILLAAYAGIGLAFATVFVFRGVGRIDPVAREAPIGFRLLIIPGAAALWPVLALRWRAAGLPSGEEARS